MIDGRIDPSSDSCECVKIALRQNNTAITQILLADDRVSKLTSMSYACEFGNVDIILELIKVHFLPDSSQTNLGSKSNLITKNFTEFAPDSIKLPP